MEMFKEEMIGVFLYFHNHTEKNSKSSIEVA